MNFCQRTFIDCPMIINDSLHKQVSNKMEHINRPFAGIQFLLFNNLRVIVQTITDDITIDSIITMYSSIFQSLLK